MIVVAVYGRGRSATSRCSNPDGLCWSSTNLVQCGSDEPSWSWTQIWAQARMPDYSLNWTAKSSAIQGGQRCQCCSSPTRRWLSQSRSLSSSNLSLISIPHPARMPDGTAKARCKISIIDMQNYLIMRQYFVLH